MWPWLTAPFAAASDPATVGRALTERLDPRTVEFLASAQGSPARGDVIVGFTAAWDELPADTPVDTRAAVAAQLLSAQIDAGLDDDAVATWAGLESATQDRLITGDPYAAELASSWRTLTWPAAPAVLAAQLLVVAPEAPDAARWRTALDAASGSYADTLRWCIDAVDAPDFDPIHWRFGGGTGTSCPTLLPSRTWQRSARARLVAHGVPEVLLEDPPDFSRRFRPGAAYRRFLRRHRDADEAVRARLAEVQARDPVPMASHPPLDAPPPSAEDRALAHWLIDRLAAPPYAPETVGPRPPAPDGGSVPTAGCAPGALRCEALDSVRYELYAGGARSLVGPIGPAELWLRVTPIDGPERRLALGVRLGSPFTLIDPDGWPLVVDGNVCLTVATQAPSLRSLWCASVEALARDTDADGLTDLVEQQLLLDPGSADSDGDGTPDGEDATPNVADDRTSEPSVALDAALRALLPAEDREDAALFLTADPAELSGFTLPERTVVLPLSLDTEARVRLPWQARFGANRVSFTTWGDERVGMLVWEGPWAGGSLVVYRHQGRWIVVNREQWLA